MYYKADIYCIQSASTSDGEHINPEEPFLKIWQFERFLRECLSLCYAPNIEGVYEDETRDELDRTLGTH